MDWMMISVGLCFLTGGLAAYRGWWRSWLSKGGGYTILGTAWIGAGTIMIGVAAPLAETGAGPAKVPTLALTTIGVCCFMVGGLSPFWMWWRFLPQWVRTTVVAYPRLHRPPRAGR